MRTISVIKRLCSKIAFQAVSVFNFARFSFVITRSIELKSIMETENLHFLSRLTHFEQFLNNKDKRYCFYLTAQRIQTIIAIIRQIESMRSMKRLLNFVSLSDMMNLRDEDFKEER